MKKIGTITFHAPYNYGSALQATALQTFLENNGYEVDILNFYDKLDMRQYKLFRTHYYFCPPIIYQDLRAYNNNKGRKKSFEDFQNKFMHFTKRQFNNNEELKEIANDYDAFICGSDQIWNVACTKGVKKPYYLDFAKDSRAFTMSYAPSIAHTSIDEKYHKEFAEVVNNIDVISVREKTGQKIIKDITGRDAKVVLDPTLLLNGIDYEHFISKDIQTENFVYVYCLEYNKDVYDYAYQLAQKKELKLIYYRKTDIPKFKNASNSFNTGPSEFLYYIKNAKYIVTNSFHATVFSILFKKQFITFATKRSSSRMVDFLTTLQLDSRLSVSNPDMDTLIDYKKVQDLLDQLKQDSIDFLLGTLKKGLVE